MVEERRRPRFSSQPLHRLEIAGRRGRQEFQRDQPTERQVLGLEDLAHATRAEFLENPIVRNRPPDHDAAILASLSTAANVAPEGDFVQGPGQGKVAQK
jgi:hypothetical protein